MFKFTFGYNTLNLNVKPIKVKCEKRLDKIEELLSIDKDSVTSDAQVEYRILQDLVNNNKDALTKIEVDLQEIKNNKKKDESSEHSELQESDRKRYKWWNRGYCKLKESCPFLHPKAICIE